MAVLRGLSGLLGVALVGCSFSAGGLTQTDAGGTTEGTTGATGETTHEASDPTTPPGPTTGPDDSSTMGPGSVTAMTSESTTPDETETTIDVTATGTGTGDTTSDPGSTTAGETSTSEPCVEAEWYADGDDDGIGDEMSTILACKQPGGYVDTFGDCDDGDPLNFPGNPELCDSQDNDCDALVDEYSADNTSCGGCKLVANDVDNPTRAYHFCDTPLAWSAAKGACESRQAGLVADELQPEHMFLVAQLDEIDAMSGAWWTGGHKANPIDGSYKWLSGVSISSLDPRWAVKPILIQSSHCVRVLSSGVADGGKWIEDACDDPLPYICEQSLM